MHNKLPEHNYEQIFPLIDYGKNENRAVEVY